jgi:hypothetical protein
MAGGNATRECRTLDTTTFGLEALLTWLAENGAPRWKRPRSAVWNILSEGTFELQSGRTSRMFPAAKTDANDGMWIADLVSCGLVRTNFVPEKIQDLRSLPRAAQAAYARADQPHPADSEDLERATSSLSRSSPLSSPEWPADDRGDDQRRQESVQTAELADLRIKTSRRAKYDALHG